MYGKQKEENQMKSYKVGDIYVYNAGEMLARHGYFHAEGLKIKCRVVEILEDAIVLEPIHPKKNHYYYMTNETKDFYEKEEN